LTPTFKLLKGVPGRSYGLAIARRLGVPEPVVRDAEAQVPDSEKALDGLLAAVELRARALGEREDAATGRTLELEGLAARLERQAADQAIREAALKAAEKQAEKAGRAQAKAYLLEARQRVEQAIAMARAAVDEITAREARRLVEEGVQAEARALAEADREEAERARLDGLTPVAGDRVRLPSGIGGTVLEVRADGKLVVGAGAVKMVLEPQLVAVDPSPAPKSKPSGAARGPGDHAAPADSVGEIDLRGFTGDEAAAATIAALDAAVMAEHPYLRIIHGMGTGVVRERVQRVLSSDRRVLKYAFAPRNQGGTGVTIAEFRA
jgi:DNA mismatch repair protein MutS2